MAYKYSEMDVGAGWRPVVRDAIDAIERLGGEIFQIKEKFGGLRIYTHGGNQDSISTVVQNAENWCDYHCEYCGAPGERKDLKGWLKTVCKDHDTIDKIDTYHRNEK